MPEIIDLGWRDGLMLAVGVSAVYLALTVLRFVQLRQRRPYEAAGFPAMARLLSEDHTLAMPNAPSARSLAMGTHFLGEPLLPGGANSQDAPAPPAMPDLNPPPASFAEALANTGFGAEAHQITREVAALRDEVAGLRQQVGTLQGELDRLKHSAQMAPLYGEALALAHQGLDADGIAQRCGISRGEAELVISLTRGPQGGDSLLVEEEGKRDGN